MPCARVLYPSSNSRQPAGVCTYPARHPRTQPGSAHVLQELTDILLLHLHAAVYVWLVASLVLDAPMPLGCRLLNHMALQPAMANPFGAATVREFWGRRYNQIVSSLLQVGAEHTRKR